MAKKEDTIEEEKKQEERAADEPQPEAQPEAGGEDAPGSAAGAAEPDGEEAAPDEESPADGAESAEESDKGGRKSLFGKKEKKDKTDPLKEQIKDLTDKCMRQMAEFENFRKRTDKEKAQMFDTGASHVIEKLLPVVDNFERGLAAVPEAQKADAFVEGMDKIYKQLYKVLEDLGVTPIEALGTEFDPNFHNAVMQTQASEEYPSGTVSQEMQKGYLYHDTVIRHSMVAVAE